MRQLLAAWMVVHEQDLPMNPRLLGKPGVGKTTLAYAAGRRMTAMCPCGHWRKPQPDLHHTHREFENGRSDCPTQVFG